jgi:type IV pilus assembly protein PilX
MQADRQSGAALVTGLVILVVMTVLAVGALRGSILEERTTADIVDAAVATEAAEAALREGEQFLLQPVLPAFDGRTPGLYAAGGAPDASTLDWSTMRAVIAAHDFADAPGVLRKVQAQFYIEQLAAPAQPEDSLAADRPLAEVAYYRVTAHAFGANGGASVTLQSTVKR